ncbi:gamma-glutamyltransferase [Mammaliicoccus lentus]|uniref:gamma-glutamyltransferase n=1 Tax=Mammaliicoccus lentus TaxID=42858 RepID=UPI001B32DD39|nr:gamma-glutamyltransferase [Mammaliicoccus lentus]
MRDMDNTIDPRIGQPFVSKNTAIASPNDLATVAGNKIMQQGGNAIDAMVAVNTTLGVVFPHMTGAGGDAFWLIYDAKTQQQYVLNASGRSVSEIDIEHYKDQGFIDNRGLKSVITIPGAVDGWYEAHKRFGKLSFAECLAPAIEYARDGIPVSKSFAQFSDEKLNILRRYDETSKIFLKDQISPYLEGDIFYNRDLANTLEEIAEKGSKGFYQGDIADKIVNYMEREGGYITSEDLRKHESKWEEPLFINYNDKTVSSLPPNSDGMATLQILGMLDNIENEELDKSTEDFINWFTRATVLAFEDRNAYLTDPDFKDVPTDKLLDEKYIFERAKRLREESKQQAPEEEINADGDTTFSCAADSEGNVVGVVQSLYWEWGSGIVPEGTGLLLQNRGAFFSLDENSPNQLEVNKRPGHTLTCSMVEGDDGPELIVGAMGGDGQPQTQATLIRRVIVENKNIQEAIDQPRWLLGRTWGEKQNGLRLEGRFNKKLIPKLEELGHNNVTLIDSYSDLVGHAQGIQIFKDRFEAGSDPRSNGLALGY